jgi:hypothetical protein
VAIEFAVPILFVVSLVVAVVVPILATPRVNVSVLRTAAVVFAVPILFVVSLVVAAVAPILATPRVNVSVLRTAAVVFAVPILFVVRAVGRVIVMSSAMAMVSVLLSLIPILNGCELRVELSRWVLMISTGHSQFIV